MSIPAHHIEIETNENQTLESSGPEPAPSRPPSPISSHGSHASAEGDNNSELLDNEPASSQINEEADVPKEKARVSSTPVKMAELPRNNAHKNKQGNKKGLNKVRFASQLKLIEQWKANPQTAIELDFEGSLRSTNDLLALYETLQSIKPTLEVLDLSDNEITSQAAGIVADIIDVCPPILLNLEKNPLGAEGYCIIASAIGRSKVEEVYLGENTTGNYLSSKAGIAIADAIRHNKSLRTLSLKGTPIHPKAVDSIAKAIPEAPALDYLDLSDTYLRQNGLGIICSAIPSSNLREVYLDMNIHSSHIEGETAQHIATAIRSPSPLKVLSLNGNPMIYQSVYIVAEALSNSTLEDLSLSNTFICSRGAIRIAEAAVGKRSLKTLDLGFNNIDDAVVFYPFLRATTLNDHLNSVNFEANPFSAHKLKVFFKDITKHRRDIQKHSEDLRKQKEDAMNRVPVRNLLSASPSPQQAPTPHAQTQTPAQAPAPQQSLPQAPKASIPLPLLPTPTLPAPLLTAYSSHIQTASHYPMQPFTPAPELKRDPTPHRSGFASSQPPPGFNAGDRGRGRATRGRGRGRGRG